MKTGNNNATNNFIIRVWSKAYYKDNKDKYKLNYWGSITDVNSKESKHFNSAGELLKTLENFNKKAEKTRRLKCK